MKITQYAHRDEVHLLLLEVPEHPGTADAMATDAERLLNGLFPGTTWRYTKTDNGVPTLFAWRHDDGLVMHAEFSRNASGQSTIEIKPIAAVNAYGFDMAVQVFADRIASRLREKATGLPSLDVVASRARCVEIMRFVEQGEWEWRWPVAFERPRHRSPSGVTVVEVPLTVTDVDREQGVITLSSTLGPDDSIDMQGAAAPMASQFHARDATEHERQLGAELQRTAAKLSELRQAIYRMLGSESHKLTPEQLVDELAKYTGKPPISSR